MRNICYILCVLCVLVDSAAAQNITRIEYFFNTDPGFGQATPLTGFTSSADVTNFTSSINLSSVSDGINNLYIRAQDGTDSWSITNVITFIKVDLSISDVVRAEYYLNTDPGFGMATTVDLVPDQNISSYIFNADVSSVAVNTTHNLFIRSKDLNGVWSLTNVLSFTKMPGVGVDEIIDAAAAFTVFPNPATDKITLQCSPDKEINKVELMDVQGKLMQAQCSGNSTEKQIDLSMLTKGIYFIKITSGKDVVYKKVLKN